MRKAFLRIRILFRIVRGLGFIVWIVVSLAISTAGFALVAAKTTAQLAVATTKVTQQASTIARQSKTIKSLRKTVAGSKKKHAKQIAKTKAKGRLRRTVTSIPLFGVAAAIAFEEVGFRSWRKENLNGSRGEYGCEVWAVTVEVSGEVLDELPEGRTKEKARWAIQKLPKCDVGDGYNYPTPQHSPPP